MKYRYHKFNFPKDVLVYIEEVNSINKTVVFDFLDSNEFTVFSNAINVQFNLKEASMVILKNYNGRRIQENTIYSIKNETIIYWASEGKIKQNEESYLIRFEIENKIENIDIFEESISVDFEDDLLLNQYIYDSGDTNTLFDGLKGNISINIRDVKQGNWNEVLYNNQVKIVFDSGAPTNASKNEVVSIIDNRNKIYPKSNPLFILSHWDKDHYHALLAMTDIELANNFCGFVCRDFLPTLTSRILFQRIKSALGSDKLYCIACNPKNQTKPFHSNINSLTNQTILYNSQNYKNRNASGLVLVIKTAKSSAILTGDTHYNRISDCILPHLNYHHVHHLVTPHHGGNAGPIKYKLQNEMKAGIGAISVGKNGFGHPDPKNIDYLEKLKFKILQTRYVGDISIPM